MRFRPAFLLDNPSAFQYQTAIFSQGRLPRGLDKKREEKLA
jgi:hypothetical protein